MTLAAVVVAVSAIFLIAIVGSFIHLSSRSDTKTIRGELVAIDVNAFRNLMEPGEELFLRENLSSPDFRKVQRMRMLAAIDYVWTAARNAGILIRVAEAARTDKDSSVVSAAENLIENATQVRLYAIRALPRLTAGLLLPMVGSAPSPMPEMYDSMSRQMVVLRCLQVPARQGAVS